MLIVTKPPDHSQQNTPLSRGIGGVFTYGGLLHSLDRLMGFWILTDLDSTCFQSPPLFLDVVAPVHEEDIDGCGD